MHLGWFDQHPYMALAGAIGLITALAAMSWHWIESPFLRKRHQPQAPTRHDHRSKELEPSQTA
ncbi:hypothetical protein D3C72_2168940 [compost metagenome]